MANEAAENTSPIENIAKDVDRFAGIKKNQMAGSIDQRPFLFQQDLAPGAVVSQSMVPGGNTKGDIYYSQDGVRMQRLPIGTTGDVLRSSSGVPSWSATGPLYPPRVASTTSSATPTPNADSYDEFSLTAQAATAAFGIPTGTPVNGQRLMVEIVDNGTARAITWNSGTGGYTGGGGVLPTTTTTGKYHHISFIYVTANSFNKWMCLQAVVQP